MTNHSMEETNMIKNKVVAFILFLVLFLVFWNMLDLLYCAVITRSSYHFSGLGDLGLPALVAAVCGYLLILRK